MSVHRFTRQWRLPGDVLVSLTAFFVAATIGGYVPDAPRVLLNLALGGVCLWSVARWWGAISGRFRDVERQVLAMQSQLERAGDITETLEHASRRFQDLFHGLPVACFSVDGQGRIFEWNAECEALFGLDFAAAWQRHPAELFKGGTVDRLNAQVAEVVLGHPVWPQEYDLVAKSGEVSVRVTMIPLRGPGDQVVGAVGTCLNVTEHRRYQAETARRIETIDRMREDLFMTNQRLEALSATDDLTQLLNSRAYRRRLSEAFELAEKRRTPLSLIMLDLDHFKRMNDRFGHSYGDRVLRATAEVVTENTPHGAIAGRYGGEEFVLLLPGSNESQAAEAAERIRAALETHDWGQGSVTASFGVAELPIGSRIEQSELFDRADKALYSAKHNGRNCVVRWSETTGGTVAA